MSELEELRQRVKFLEEQNKQLIDALVNAAKPSQTIPVTDAPYRKCLVCGLEGVVGYVCTRNDCPTAVRC